MQELGPVTEGSFYLPNRNWSCKWGFESLSDRQLDFSRNKGIITLRGVVEKCHDGLISWKKDVQFVPLQPNSAGIV